MKLTTEKTSGEFYVRVLALELLALTLLALFCRLPFFFKSVIDWDESTFILVGQSILDGYLPYTQLWELKPPFAFGFYSLSILLFGKTIAAVRFAGTLVVAFTAFVVNRATQRLSTVQAGRIAGVLLVLLMSVMPSGQAVMSEHIATLPMILALYLLVKRGVTTATVFYSALLLSTAAMVRLNIAYVAVGIGFYLLIIGFKQPLRKQALRLLAYSVGGVIPAFVSFLPYWTAGIPLVWWNSVVVASLYRADIATKSYELIRSFWAEMLDDVFKLSGLSLQILLVIGAIAVARAMLKRNQQMQPQQKLGWSLIVIFFWTLQFSALSTGHVHLHYLLQLVPFLVPFLGVLADAAIRQRRQFVIATLVLCLSAYPVFNQYAAILPRALTGAQLDPSSARQIADYFIDNELEDRSIYMMTDHIVYWYLDRYPLTPSTTHPSTIGRDYLLQVLYGPDWSSLLEMKRLLALEPEFIVKKDWLFYLQFQPETTELLETALDQNYTLVRDIQGVSIYRRDS